MLKKYREALSLIQFLSRKNQQKVKKHRKSVLKEAANCEVIEQK